MVLKSKMDILVWPPDEPFLNTLKQLCDIICGLFAYQFLTLLIYDVFYFGTLVAYKQEMCFAVVLTLNLGEIK